MYIALTLCHEATARSVVANGERKTWLFPAGLWSKRADPGKETEVQNEQPVVEEIVQAQEPVKASEQAVEEQPQAHTEAEAETLLPTLWKSLNRLLKVKSAA